MISKFDAANSRGTILEQTQDNASHVYTFTCMVEAYVKSTVIRWQSKKQHRDAIQSRCDDRLKKEKQLESVTTPLN